MRFVSTRLGLLLTALPLSSLLFACGGGDKKVELDQWVSDLCDAAADFQKASDKAGEEFLDADLENTKEAKKAFAESLKEQKDAQKDFRGAFDKIGQPDIDGGDKVVKAFKEQFEANDELTDDVEKAVKDIDDDDDFLGAFLDISEDFDEPDFRAALADLAEDSDDVQDLIDAIDDDEDCSGTIFDADAADDIDQDSTPAAGKTTTTGNTPVVGRTATTGRTPVVANTANEKWVSGVCGSFTNWVNDLVSANTKFQNDLDKSSGDSAAVKKLLVDFLKLGQTETKNLQKEISALKAPEVKDGAKVHKIFVDTSGNLVKVFDGLVSDANKISTASPSQTAADVDRLAAGISDAFDEAGAGFDQLDNFKLPELEALFDSRAECSEF